MLFDAETKSPPTVGVLPYVVAPSSLRRDLLAVPYQARRGVLFMGSGAAHNREAVEWLLLYGLRAMKSAEAAAVLDSPAASSSSKKDSGGDEELGAVGGGLRLILVGSPRWVQTLKHPEEMLKRLPEEERAEALAVMQDHAEVGGGELYVGSTARSPTSTEP